MRTIVRAAGTLLILTVLASSALAASRISVDRPTVRVGETFRVTITLEGEAAEIDRLPIPLTNVEMLGSPNVARQFSLINGRFSRVKILDYAARPLAEGRAIVGPIRVALGSTTLEIPGAAVEVLPATAPGQETPASVLREMERESREAVFVTVQADRNRAVVGQQVVVTWTVWARDNMSEPSIIDLPRLEGFLAEEIPTHREITSMVVDGDLLARSVVRKVALFPMRAGALEVGSLEVRAGTYQRRDPFGFLAPFRAGFANVNRSSPPLTIQVDPVPRDADVVGSFVMRCTEPVSRGGGPVSFVVTIEGEGNLRIAPPPRFESEPAAEIQIEEREVEVHRSASGLRMTRSWTVLAIPGR
ncbi:MAG: BatD family protein, partial [Acidobacteria bacterium]|nr:BatD family protein [Acidobacteriota bacterium]